MVTHGYDHPSKFLQIKQDDKFFSKLLAKEGGSSENESSSFRVFSYYGGAAGAVPFLWESQPGTPKHTFSDASPLPPLTPPPSYQLTPQMAMEYNTPKRSKSKVFHSIFHRTKTNIPLSYSSSSISSPSSSNSYSLPSTPMNSNVRSKLISRSRTPVYYGADDDENDDDHLQQQLPEATTSPTSTLCFGGRSGGRRRVKGAHYYPVKNLRKAILSMVGHGAP